MSFKAYSRDLNRSCAACACLSFISVLIMTPGEDFSSWPWWSVSEPSLISACERNFGAKVPLGESGLGKSTLINTLFETKLYQPKQVPGPGMDRGRTVQIESISDGEYPKACLACF